MAKNEAKAAEYVDDTIFPPDVDETTLTPHKANGAGYWVTPDGRVFLTGTRYRPPTAAQANEAGETTETTPPTE